MVEQQVDETKRPPAIKLPLQVSAASTHPREESVPVEAREPSRSLFDGRFSFRTRRSFLRFLRWFGIFLAAILLVDGLFWLWVWHLTPEEFQRFTACLDAGVVPSFWERFVYHIACFGGSL